MQGGQEALELPSLIPFLNFQYRAGPHTPKADITANTTKQHLKHAPDRLVISLSLSFSLSEMVRSSPQLVSYVMTKASKFSCFLTFGLFFFFSFFLF